MHPILARRGRLGPYLGAWLSVLVLLVGLVRLAARVSWPEAAAAVVLPAVIYAFMCLAAYFPCKSAPLRAGGLGKVIRSHAMAAGLTTLLWVLFLNTWLVLIEPVRVMARVIDRTPDFLPVLVIAALVIYLLVAALCYLLIGLEEGQLAETRLLHARAQAAEAELRALQAQLDPHFLFNALNSVSALIGSDPARARRMCQVVAELLRDILRLRAEPTIEFARELQLVDRYLEIEGTRFGDRLQVVREIDPGLGEIPVPPLLLQPLVENAIKHGISQLVEGGTVRVAARRAGDVLEIEVHNPAEGEGLATRREGVGLASVRARLAALHGEGARLDVQLRDGVFAARLTVPVSGEGPVERAP